MKRKRTLGVVEHLSTPMHDNVFPRIRFCAFDSVPIRYEKNDGTYQTVWYDVPRKFYLDHAYEPLSSFTNGATYRHSDQTLVLPFVNTVTGQHVALKITQKSTEHNSVYWLRSMQDRGVLKDPDHYLLSTYGMATYRGTVYSVMECGDIDAFDYITDNSIHKPSTAIKHVLRETALAIKMLHKCKEPTPHGDLKCENVLLMLDTTTQHPTHIRLIDFSPTDCTDVSPGTYMCPSRWKTDKRTPTLHDDMFAFGCMVYTMVAKRLPSEVSHTVGKTQAEIYRYIDALPKHAKQFEQSGLRKLMIGLWDLNDETRWTIDDVLNNSFLA